MSMLLIDIGNSRIKWACARHGKIGPQRAFEHGGRAKEFSPLLAGLPPGIDVIRAASVVHDGLAERLAAKLLRATGVTVDYLETQRATAGVRCGYREPWRLGVDRWAAIIGAHHHFTKACDVCVVDVGTAMTLDLVDRAGRHHGGSIVPGPQAMVDTLMRGTSGIGRRAAAALSRDRSLFARGTRDAIVHGARNAAAAWVERACEEAQGKLRRKPALLITGGGAADLVPYLVRRHEAVPDLVLRGLLALG